MDFSISKQQHELQELAREALTRVVKPVAERRAPGEKLAVEDMRDIYRGLAPLGYLGGTIPERLGGGGMSYVDYGLLLEALAAGPVLLGEVVPPRTVAWLGNKEQQARWLPGLLSGDLVGTAAITEPQAGSDIRNLQTLAERTRDGWRLTGAKKWIKLGGICDVMTVLAVTDAKTGGTSRFMVERAATPWRSRELDSVGIRNLSFAELELDGLEIPEGNLLGEAGGGSEVFIRAIEASRPLVGMQAVGIARHALDLAVKYARERTAFGRKLSRFQAIQTQLADAASELEAARLLCLSALWTLDDGRRAPKECSMAKLFATEAAIRIAHAAMDAMGAAGLAEESGVERCWRDARMLTVIDGTSGIQRLVIGRELLGQAAFV